MGTALMHDTQVGSQWITDRRKTLVAVYPTAEIPPKTVPMNAGRFQTGGGVGDKGARQEFEFRHGSQSPSLIA